MKKTKILLVSWMCLFACGCVWQTADMTDILKAEQFCSEKGGLKI